MNPYAFSGSLSFGGAMTKIAIVDDDETINDGYHSWIQKEYPDAQIDQITSFKDAMERLAQEKYDLVLLDLQLGRTMQERVGGFTLAKILQERQIPVVIVSGTPQEMLYKPIIAELFAWDYLQKPVNQLDLLTTIQQVLKETAKKPSDKSGTSDTGTADPDLKIDPLGRQRVLWKGRVVPASITQVKILEALVRGHDTVISYETLAGLCRSSRARENLRVHIQQLRDGFEGVDETFDRLDTVTMKGYIWRLGNQRVA